MPKDKLEKPSEGYFLAKREAGLAIMNRVMSIEEQLKDPKTDSKQAKVLIAKIEALEEVRSFIRNVMLWDTGRGA